MDPKMKNSMQSISEEKKYLDPKIYDLIFDWEFDRDKLTKDNFKYLIDNFPYKGDIE